MTAADGSVGPGSSDDPLASDVRVPSDLSEAAGALWSPDVLVSPDALLPADALVPPGAVLPADAVLPAHAVLSADALLPADAVLSADALLPPSAGTPRRGTTRRTGPVRPSLRVEKKLLAEGRVTVIGVDEVGRGAIAGPVAVGVAAVTVDVRRVPQGLADSKLLSAARRTALVPHVQRWATTAVGMTPADVIDAEGIVVALGRAGALAIDGLVAQGVTLEGAVVLLDGSFDWLSRALDQPVDVHVRVKADRDCASVAAASVVAKVERDALMVAAHDEAPHYAWASNKGYGSAAHYDGIRSVGPHPLHRRTWLHDESSVTLDGFEDLAG